MNRRTALLLLGSVLSLGGCTHPPYGGEYLEIPTGSAYTLSSGDRLRIIVFGQDNLSNIYAVDGSGRISMPLIGLVPVAGQTTAQVEHAIAVKLKAGYVREPKVTVEVDVYRPFFVLGEVTTSGQFPYVNGMTVQTAVASPAATRRAPPRITPSSRARAATAGSSRPRCRSPSRCGRATPS